MDGITEGKGNKEWEKTLRSVDFDCSNSNNSNVLCFVARVDLKETKLCPFWIQFYHTALWIQVPAQHFISARWLFMLVSEIPIPCVIAIEVYRNLFDKWENVYPL